MTEIFVFFFYYNKKNKVKKNRRKKPLVTNRKQLQTWLILIQIYQLSL